MENEIMVSPTGPELEKLYDRLNVIVPLRGATTPEELLKRFHKIKSRTTSRYKGNIDKLIDHDIVSRLLRHYYRGKRLGADAKHTSKFIYRRMKP